MDPAVVMFSKESELDETRISNSPGRQWSFWMWTVILFLINLPLLWGGVNSDLIFWPKAVQNGQWWRVVTYPLVHLSWYHFLLDAGGFLLLYSALEEKRTVVKALYLIAPGTGSLLLTLAVAPDIFQQGLSGLSGIAHGLMAITAMEMWREKDQRIWGWISLGIVTLKSLYELWSGHVLFEFMHMGLCGQPLAASHAGGVIGGVVVFTVINLPAKFYVHANNVGGRKRSCRYLLG